MLSKQLHIGAEKPQLDLFNKPISSLTAPLNKPYGGFWTSSYMGEVYGSDWVQYNLSNDLTYSGEKHPSWLLTPSKNAVVYVIDDYSDLHDLKIKYSKSLVNGVGVLIEEKFSTLDFEAISKDFDAIHLTSRGQMLTRYSMPFNLYGWDCESVLWLNFCFDKVEWLGEIEYKEGV